MTQPATNSHEQLAWFLSALGFGYLCIRIGLVLLIS